MDKRRHLSHPHHCIFATMRGSHHAFSMRRSRILPFWEETDCSISVPNIATERDMTAALRLPGIIFGGGGWKMPVGKR